MRHTVLTFITEVKSTQVAVLETLLAQVAAGGNPLIPFSSLPRLHFASLVLLPADPPFKPQLVFENNFDGPLEPHLADLVNIAGEGLHSIYSCCQDYPPNGEFNSAGLANYLRQHVVPPNAYHVGNVGLSVDRIRREAALRERLEQELDALEQAGQLAKTPHAIRSQLQDAISRDPRFAWARSPEPAHSPLEKLLPHLQNGLLLIGGILLLRLPRVVLGPAAGFPVTMLLVLGTAALLPVTVLVLKRREQSDVPWTGQVDDQHLAALLAKEDQPGIVQNHVTSLSRVKPGWFRRAVLSSVLWFANRQARASTSGTLSGIPTIHFAHWSMIDGGRRLLFLSNYGGSWGSYLDDFIDKASDGLTAIWSNCEGFPRTEYHFFSNRALLSLAGGSRDGPRFKAVVRDRQLPTTVWHSPYHRLTVPQINRNRELREGLFAQMDERGERKWLRYL